MSEIFLSDKVNTLMLQYKKFLTEEIYPVEMAVLKNPFRQSLPLLNSLRAKAKERKLWAPHLPAAEGGLDLTLPEFAHISEVMGMSPLGHYLFNCQAPDIGNMELMLHFATAELKAKYLKPLMNGAIRSCFAMTEPEFAGSNPLEMATTAYREGDYYIINGHKWFTTGADGAHFTIVMALTDPQHSNPYLRASMILVPLDNPGYKLIRNIPVMGDAGEDYLSHGEVQFTNCKVPVTNRIGDEGQGFALAQARLGPGRIHHCMRWIGICERAFDMMCKRAVSRQIKEGKVLAHQQAIQFWIAESRAEINAARCLVMHAAQVIDQQGAKAAKDEIAAVKFFVADVLMKVIDRAIQVHGGLGVTDDTLLAFWYRHERAARIYDGPDEVHKAALAKSILKKYMP
jgi:acyl-CoA dehydrogenase